ncbi:hypothetical protein Y032_0639g983 [Ancylostoma ceylanicum]|uniref:Uncharacterized protein n=1 Tax=Ancylostoma ceylanicum TaxID=53326 RepID=A0A016WLA0_9BILA|nr:hypothetical protein Y032_0639g983 [Ancylostoma ceylanicum]
MQPVARIDGVFVPVVRCNEFLEKLSEALVIILKSQLSPKESNLMGGRREIPANKERSLFHLHEYRDDKVIRPHCGYIETTRRLREIFVGHINLSARQAGITYESNYVIRVVNNYVVKARGILAATRFGRRDLIARQGTLHLMIGGGIE